MSLLEVLTQGLTGGALGAIGGIAEKLLTQRMANKQEQASWEHIRQMHTLQAKLDAQKAEQNLTITRTEGEYAGLSESIKHDAALKFQNTDKLLETRPWLGAFVAVLQAIVNTIRALFRPFLTLYLVNLATIDADFIPLASAAVFWWIGSRGRASDTRAV